MTDDTTALSAPGLPRSATPLMQVRSAAAVAVKPDQETLSGTGTQWRGAGPLDDKCGAVIGSNHRRKTPPVTVSLSD